MAKQVTRKGRAARNEAVEAAAPTLPTQARAHNFLSQALAARALRTQLSVQPPRGTVRACVPHRGELARHRVITAEGRDVAITTITDGVGYLTGVYPVQQGYLVMVCQPLIEVRSAQTSTAQERHEALVRTAAQVGLTEVRRRERHLRGHQPAAHPADVLGLPPVVAEREVERDGELALSRN